MATAEQTVSAVLESTNKRYVVETGQTENGWFTRYSDGWVEQVGYVPLGAGIKITVTLPIKMQDERYALTISTVVNGDVENYETGYLNKTTTSFVLQMAFAAAAKNSASWVVQGFAA